MAENESTRNAIVYSEQSSNPTIEDMLRILQQAEKLHVTDKGAKLSIPSISNNFTLATQAKLIKSGSKLTVTQQDSVTSLLIPVIQEKISEGDCQINFIPTLEDEDEFFIQIENSKLGTRNCVADNAGLPGLRHRDPDSRTNTNQRWKLVRLGESKILIKSTSTGLVLDAGIEHSCGLISPHVFSRMKITCFDQLSATQVWNCCKIPEKLEIDSPILFVPTGEENRFMIQVITNIADGDQFLTVNDDSTIVLSSKTSKIRFSKNGSCTTLTKTNT